MKSLAAADVRDTIAAYIESEERLSASCPMSAMGYEACLEDGTITHDGREIVVVDNKRWVLRPEIHFERRAADFEVAKNSKSQPHQEIKSIVGTEALSAMVCPKCGDTLQHTAVCPKCAAGKIGYRHRYTCVCGGVDLVSKDAL
jgi:rubrerythrin